MELHERFVSAFMGALWGAILGVLVGLFCHLVFGDDFDSGFLILNWKNIIAGSSGLFAVLGLIFKASIGTVIGTLMSWTWDGIQVANSNNFLANFILVFAVILIWYLYSKG
jgi:hypothetical protein